MRESNTPDVSALRLAGSAWRYLDSAPRNRGVAQKAFVTAVLLACVALGPAAAPGGSAQPTREAVTKIVVQIQRADYEGDRAALKRLYGELTPFVEDKELASRVRYWRGFALWRRAVNGFNDSVDPKEQEADLTLAVDEFNKAAASDPGFLDAKVGAVACLGLCLSLNQKDPARMQELMAQVSPIMKEARAADPDNPRLIWVLGPILWRTPAERGGGQDKAIETYHKGLEEVRKRKATASDPLEPSWGEPELLMALAWSNLNRTTPDLNAAEQYARSALEIVPYWHYVRDILMQQIKDAKAKAS
jgi:hypothetical protein